jgi:hypothetical protein
MYPTTTIEKILAHDASQAREMSRLLTAAVVNPEFRNLLLTNPPIALSSGYNGETFDFTLDAQALILSIQANSLEEFATQLVKGRDNGKGHGPTGSGQRINEASKVNGQPAEFNHPYHGREMQMAMMPGLLDK